MTCCDDHSRGTYATESDDIAQDDLEEQVEVQARAYVHINGDTGDKQQFQITFNTITGH